MNESHRKTVTKMATREEPQAIISAANRNFGFPLRVWVRIFWVPFWCGI